MSAGPGYVSWKPPPQTQVKKSKLMGETGGAHAINSSYSKHNFFWLSFMIHRERLIQKIKKARTFCIIMTTYLVPPMIVSTRRTSKLASRLSAAWLEPHSLQRASKVIMKQSETRSDVHCTNGLVDYLEANNILEQIHNSSGMLDPGLDSNRFRRNKEKGSDSR